MSRFTSIEARFLMKQNSRDKAKEIKQEKEMKQAKKIKQAKEMKKTNKSSFVAKWMPMAFRRAFLLASFMVLFTACGKAQETYQYEDPQEVFEISIDWTKVYEDRVEVQLSDDDCLGYDFSDAEKLICYNADFEVIEEDADFDMEDEVLIIYSDAPEEISGLRIDLSTDLYFCVRYLDSDNYAMLGYSWADDVGMLSSGDEEAYYTEEEKEAQAREEEERIAEYNRIYQMLEGVWEDEEGTCRIEVWESGPEENYKRYITLYRMEDGEWVQDMIMYAKTLWAWDTENGVSVEVTEGSYGYRMGFDLYYDMDDDLTVMESDHFMGVMLQRVE
ncbi:MAG: hypothetical protein E7285_00900 [Lachnospiraceae bacterium]|nr:hypothetical protein [Lachnospiraceae bacterium]